MFLSSFQAKVERPREARSDSGGKISADVLTVEKEKSAGKF